MAAITSSVSVILICATAPTTSSTASHYSLYHSSSSFTTCGRCPFQLQIEPLDMTLDMPLKSLFQWNKPTSFYVRIPFL